MHKPINISFNQDKTDTFLKFMTYTKYDTVNPSDNYD